MTDEQVEHTVSSISLPK